MADKNDDRVKRIMEEVRVTAKLGGMATEALVRAIVRELTQSPPTPKPRKKP